MTRASSRQLQSELTRLISHQGFDGNLDGRIRLLQDLRARSPQDAQAIDRWMIATQMDQCRTLEHIATRQEKLRALLDKMSAPPWVPGRILGVIEQGHGPRALVHGNGAVRLVELGEGVDPALLVKGTTVFLSQDENVLMATAPNDLMRWGETAFYDRLTADRRLVLKVRDEEVVMDAASSLDLDALRRGDELLVDRGAWMALEVIESDAGEQYLAGELVDLGLESVGGLDGCVERVFNAVVRVMAAPELADSYGIGGRRTILLHGPPGCGKTLIARCMSAEIGRVSGRRCQFFVIKPGEWESPWVGEAQANIRRCFEALKKAAQQGMVVLFIDEVESLGRHRGGMAAHHSDRFLGSWLVELDGFEDRGNVAIISATNRKDLLDPALLQRLSDVEIAVPRPSSDGAARIFEIHLGEKVPVHPNGSAAAVTRREIIEVGVSRLYAPNGENEIGSLQLRDGTRRALRAPELVSGRLIQQICRSARESAFVRHLAGGTEGVTIGDMERAVSEAVGRLASVLTPRNAHEYLDDLPQDLDVVRVESPQRQVKRPIRYLNTD